MLNSKLFLFTLVGFVLLLLGSCSNIKVETKDNYDWRELPDGSIVYLNHNSLVVYDETFEPRNIRLAGEAFISVVSGETPFIVTTTLGDITVTGTEFNIRSIAKEIAIEVEEGSVELRARQHHANLKRGDRAVYNTEKGAIHKEKTEFEFRLWLSKLEVEFKKLGKEVKHTTKAVGKESRKVGKELKKGIKKLKVN